MFGADLSVGMAEVFVVSFANTKCIMAFASGGITLNLARLE